jgi:hypothetical protein
LLIDRKGFRHPDTRGVRPHRVRFNPDVLDL